METSSVKGKETEMFKKFKKWLGGKQKKDGTYVYFEGKKIPEKVFERVVNEAVASIPKEVDEQDAKKAVERIRDIIATETGLSKSDKRIKEMVFVYHYPGGKFPLVVIKSDVNGNVWPKKEDEKVVPIVDQTTGKHRMLSKTTDRIMQRIANELGCEFGFIDDCKTPGLPFPYYVVVGAL
jgi:hypothetical protein